MAAAAAPVTEQKQKRRYMGFLTSLFGSGRQTPEQQRDKQTARDFDVLKYDGVRAQGIRRFDYARKCFEEALRLREDYETLGYLSNLLIATNHAEDAVGLLQRMIGLKSEATDVHNTLANVYYILEDYANMEEVLDASLLIAPDNARTHYVMGKAKRSLGKADEAIAHLTTAIGLQEAFGDALLLRGEIYADKGDHAAALADAEAVLSISDSDESATMLKAHVMSQTDRTAEAEQAYRRVLDINPFNRQAYTDLARLLTAQQRYDDASALLSEAVDLSPDFAEAYSERAAIRRLVGDEEGAAGDEATAQKLLAAAADNANADVPDASQAVRKTDILGL